MRATMNQNGARCVRGCGQLAPVGRWTERGAAGPLGLLAIFVATAMVLTVIMLFVTGVAQQGILPRVRARALRAVNPELTDSTAVQTQGQASADPQTAGAEPGASGGSAAPASPALSQAQLDSLRTLNDQIRVSRESLEDRISTVHQEALRLEQERSAADEEAERRLKTLAKVYSSMKPEAAARVMASLDDTTFARVLANLDRRQAAKVLALLDPERVARLTQEAATSVADRGGH